MTAVAAVALLAVVFGAWPDGDGAGASTASERLAVLDCEIEDRGESQPADRNGLPYDVRTHACVVDGEPIAFHFEFLTEPTIHQVGEVDDPEGASLAVSGDGWRIHLVGDGSNDGELADEIAVATDGDVGRLLTAFVCRIRHPDDEL